MTTTVYVFSNTEGAPLYVGVSGHMQPRISNHRKRQVWWADVATARFEHFDTREEAMVREGELIRELHPAYNRAPGTLRTVEELVEIHANRGPRSPIHGLFGDNLRWARLQLHLTQEQLAEKLGIGSRNISRWEAGHNQPRGGYLVALADALDQPVAWFYTDHQNGKAAA